MVQGLKYKVRVENGIRSVGMGCSAASWHDPHVDISQAYRCLWHKDMSIEHAYLISYIVVIAELSLHLKQGDKASKTSEVLLDK